MKKAIFIIGMAFSFFALNSCERDITALNVDPKHPSTLPSETFFSSSQLNLINRMVTPSVNSNISRFFTQQWSQTTYTDESNYDFVTRQINTNHWNLMYNDVLYGLKLTADKLAVEPEPTLDPVVTANKKATVEIMAVYAWSNLVDTYNNVPYTEALKPTGAGSILQPKYDDAKTIYSDLIKRLDAAIATINQSKKGFSGDLIYGGNMQKWYKFANSLKLRMGINLADVDATLSKATVESAYNKVFTSNSDNALVDYPGGQYANPIYLELNGRTDYVGSDVLINALNAKNDPRITSYFEPTATGSFVGGKFGANNNYGNNSHVNETYVNNETAKGDLLDYAEVCFILAEAAQRGYSVGGTAAAWYDKGVLASMSHWHVSSADAATYLAANPYDAANWKQSIGEQAWFAMYNRGYEAWTFSRRLDFPKFVNPVGSDTKGVPTRMTYPAPEQSLNKANYEAAAATLSGGDDATSKVFWDKF